MTAVAINYVALADTAKRLIEVNGRELTLAKASRDLNSSADPWRGTVGPSASAVAVGIIVPYMAEDMEDGVIRREDQRLFIAVNSVVGVAVETFDTVLDGAKRWKIVKVELVKPGAVGVVYDIQLRR